MKGVVTASTVEIVASNSTVLHDEHGNIKHVHHTTILKGGTLLSPKEMESHAANALARRGLSHAGLTILHVPTSTFEIGKRYKVDVANKAIVAHSVPLRSS